MPTQRQRSEGKRRPYNRACEQCSRVKKKCDGGRPCSRCARLNLECCDKIDHRFAAHKRERNLDTSEEAAAKRAALSGMAGSALPSSALRGAPFMASSSVPARVSTGTFGSAAAAPAAVYGGGMPSPAAASALAMQQAQAAARQQTAAAVQQQAALLTLGLGLPTLLNLNRAALAEVGTSPQAVLAALSNPNNAIGQILQSSSAMTMQPRLAGALAACAPMYSDAGDAADAGAATFAAPNARAAALHGCGAEAAQQGMYGPGSAEDNPRLQQLLQQKRAQEATHPAWQGKHGGRSIKDGAPCLLRDITGSLELPAGLRGEDAMVHHSATLVLSMCPMPTCRVVMDGRWGVPLSVHANRGIAGMFNWCLHDLVTPVRKMTGFMPFQDTRALLSRVHAAQQARQQGLTSYSVRTIYVRPKSDSKGGWFDPQAATFERVGVTEVIDVQRARNGSVVYNINVMDIRALEEGSDVNEEDKQQLMAIGKRMSECLDDYVAEIGPRLRSPAAAPGAHGGSTHSHNGPRSTDAERKEEHGSAIEAWTASQGVSPELAAARVAASGFDSPPAIFEARTSLHAGKVKSIMSSNHVSLGCVAYLAYMACMGWSGHPRLLQMLTAAAEAAAPPAPPLPAAGQPHGDMKDIRAFVPPATRTGAPATFDATRPSQPRATVGKAAPAPPTPAPASSAPSLDQLSQAAGMALQREQEAEHAHARGEVASAANPSTADSSGSSAGGPGGAAGWAVGSLPDHDSLRQPDSTSQAGDFSGGVPVVGTGGGAGGTAEASSVGGFSLDRWDGSSTADGVGAFDQLMHPMAAGGVRMAPGAAPLPGMGSVGSEDKSGFVNFVGGATLADVVADMVRSPNAMA